MATSYHSWHFDSPEYSLPDNAGSGRMQRFCFSSGLALYRSEFRIEKNCEVETYTSPSQIPDLLCCHMLLSGKSLLITEDGHHYGTTTEQAMMFHLPQPHARIVMPGSQLVRHVGITVQLDQLQEHLQETLPSALYEFNEYGNKSYVRYVAFQNRLRKLVSETFTSNAGGTMQTLALEGLTMDIFVEFSRAFLKQRQTSDENPIPHWDHDTFHEILAYIRRNLSLPLRAEDLEQRFGLSKYRLYSLFQSELNCSLGTFLRQERLQKARQLLASEKLPAKVVAHEVGYRHVSNFTLAYRQYFGETPGQAKRSGGSAG